MMKQSNRWSLVVGIGGWFLASLLVIPLSSDRRQGNLVASTAWAASAESGKERATERWQDVLGKAKKEGKVVLLGPPVAEVRPSIIQAFQKEFPEIALDYQPGSLGPMTAKLRAELASKKTSFDVAIGGTSVLRSGDLFDPINTRLMHPDANRPEAWRSTRGKGLKWVDHEKQFALQTSEWVFA